MGMPKHDKNYCACSLEENNEISQLHFQHSNYRFCSSESKIKYLLYHSEPSSLANIKAGIEI